MLVDFFFTLRRQGVKTSITELLDLLNALQQQLVFADTDAFYQLARLTLVKDESQYDKFDRAFAEYFEGVAAVDLASQIPDDWLIPDLIRQLSAEDKAALQGMGSLEALLKQLRERLAEQQKRHAGGNKWIGTGGTSPFGAYGFNPEGVRIGQQGSGARRAVKVWDKREFKDLDSDSELNNRSIKLALKQLRKFARSGAETELDLHGTIQATSEQAGWLDLRFMRERHNAIKLLVFFDIGGSMDDHIEQCQKLGFAGELWPIHPTRESIAGVRCFKSVADLPHAPDVAFIAVNRHATIDVVAQLSKIGTGGAVCYASGFAESGLQSGVDGSALQQQLILAAGKMPLLGPNCYGYINALDGVALWPDQQRGRRVQGPRTHPQRDRAAQHRDPVHAGR